MIVAVSGRPASQTPLLVDEGDIGDDEFDCTVSIYDLDTDIARVVECQHTMATHDGRKRSPPG